MVRLVPVETPVPGSGASTVAGVLPGRSVTMKRTPCVVARSPVVSVIAGMLVPAHGAARVQAEVSTQPAPL